MLLVESSNSREKGLANSPEVAAVGVSADALGLHTGIRGMEVLAAVVTVFLAENTSNDDVL